MDEKVKYWLDIANEDINVAEALSISEKYLYAGFMCHLAAEKALKAIIESTSQTPAKIHNLIKLAEIGGLLGKMSNDDKQLLTILNPLQIEARYPAYKEEVRLTLSKEKCDSIITQTKELINWIEQQL
jgi:HEPN domain-containing protein